MDNPTNLWDHLNRVGASLGGDNVVECNTCGALMLEGMGWTHLRWHQTLVRTEESKATVLDYLPSKEKTDAGTA